MLLAADWLGLKDVLAEKMRRLTMEKVMGKLEEMIPRQLNERASPGRGCFTLRVST